MYLILLIYLIIIGLLIYSYYSGKLSGAALTIIILIMIILILLIPSLIGFSLMASLKMLASGRACNIMSLPLDINKVSQCDNGDFVYNIRYLKR